MNGIYKYWHLFWLLRRMHLQRMFEYRANFLFWGGISAMWTIFNVFFFDLVTGTTGHIAGWSRGEMKVLLGVFNIIDAFTWSFFYHNMTEYTRSIFDGTLNTWLTKPVDTQVMLMIKNNSYSNIFRFILGFLIIGWGAQELPYHLTIASLGWFVIALCLAGYLVYISWFCCSTCAFWVDKLDNINEVFPAFRRLWQLPRSVYSGATSTLLTLILPLGLISSVPAELLLGRPSLLWLGHLFIFTIGVTLFSRWFFSISVRKYSGVAN
ncbi:MAG TPA: ABC-2 family transporter protein [Vitreimonas sp.]|nr:ABC-2 family transporter protein [Vitreimonas sp.]